MFCKNCGTQLKDGATFCTECGWKVDRPGGQIGGGNAVVPPPNIGNPNVDIPGQNMANQNMAGPYNAQSAGNMNQGNMNRGNMDPRNMNPQPARNMNRQQALQPAKKKGHTVAIVLAAVFGTIILGFILLVIIGLNASDTETAKATGTDVTTVSGSEVTRSGGEVDPDAINQLLAIFDELEQTTETMGNDVGDDDVKAWIDLSNKWYTQLEDQYKRVQEIKGLPENVRKAASDAFEMYMAAIECMNKDFVFLQDIIELSETIKEDDLTQTYYDFKEKHENTECPANMADSWKAIGKSLDFLAESVNRSIDGESLNDSLRIFSSNNHLTRFGTVFENEMNRIVDVNTAEQNFMLEQLEIVGSIDKEIRDAYAADPEGIGNYEFKYNVDNVIPDPTYAHIENIYPSLYNTYDSFVTVNIGCLLGERDIIIECEIPGLSQSMSQSYHIGPALTSLNIKPPASNEKLNLDTAKDTQIKVTIKDKKDGSTIDAQSFPVHIYGRNDFAWYSDEFGTITQDNILCFLAPDSEAITELKRNAIDILTEMSGEEMNSLVGYQGPFFMQDADGDGYADNLEQAQIITTFLQAASLMRSMSDMGVRYTNDSFSIDQAGQHILFPDQVLNQKTGLCIETSLVIASALQSMGMHTCLIFPPGHAQVAVETWDGSGNWLLIETTALPNENEAFVDDANAILSGWETKFDDFPIAYYTPDQWAEYLVQDPEDDSDDCYVLDCGDGALLGMTPFAY